MGKKDKKPQEVVPAAGAPVLANNPFGALAGLRDALPEAARAPEAAPGAAPSSTPMPAPPRRAVVRYERAGRGGKEATLIEKLALDEPALATWCREIKAALGCGGAVEEDAIVLQGDQRKRLPKLLEQRGIGKITVS